jgi:hypothetical protein
MFPESRLRHAAATESDGSVVPVVSRPFDDESLVAPLNPAGVNDWIRSSPDVAARHADTRQ